SWDKDYSVIDSDIEIYPIFEATVRTFTVVFKDNEGNILKVEHVESGMSATAPTNIKEKPSTDMYEYIIRWSKDYTNVKTDLVVELYYEEVERIYYARFYHDLGELYITISGTYGQTIESPMPPEKPMTNQYMYHFVGWSPTLDETLIKDGDYYPVYDRTIRQYLVEFIDGNGDVYDSQLVPYGQTPKTPTGTPVKDANEQYYYVFRMWETTTVKVYQDLVINAVFYRYLQEYQVTFTDEYGNILQVQMVQYGLGATEPDSSIIPDKPSTKEYVYIFAGWDKSFSYITEDTVIQTVYIATLRKYTYTFYDEDEVTILKEITGAYGDPIIAPAPPKKDATESTVFEFLGWHIPVAQVLTEDIFYMARYKEVPKTFRVIFIDGNGILVHAETVDYGKDAKGPTTIPTKLPSAMYQYAFIGWDITFNNVTSDLTVTAQFERQLRDLQVTFIMGEEEVIEYVQYGKSAYNLVATPYLKGYRFIDWDT